METYRVDLGERSYPIYIGSGLIRETDYLSKHVVSKQVMVVTNDTVAPLYLSPVLEKLSGFEAEVLILPDGEQHKNLETASRIFDALMEKRFSRNATLIALGGGVIGDTVGFAAACFQRGIAFIQVPTTLLAQVDSSVGGKTGVNHPLGKNMIGAFFQPRCVIADITVLQTLDDRQMSAGLAEIIKYGLIQDAEFFDWLERNVDALCQRKVEALTFAIQRSCVNKAEIVAADERESGVRALLNLGHTFGHAIETGSGYGTYLHGEAVSIGICQAADLSRRLAWLSKRDFTRIKDLLKRANLPTTPPSGLKCREFLEIMSVDKKNIDRRIRLILLDGIGKGKLPCYVEQSILEETLNEYGRE